MKKNEKIILQEEPRPEKVEERNLNLNDHLELFIQDIQDQNDGNDINTKAKSEENNNSEKKLNALDNNDKEKEIKGVELFGTYLQEKEDINFIKEEQLGINNEPEIKKVEEKSLNIHNNNFINESLNNNNFVPIIVNTPQIILNNPEEKEKEIINKDNSPNNNIIPNQNKILENLLLEKGIIHQKSKEGKASINLDDLFINGNDSSLMDFDNINDINSKGDNNDIEEDLDIPENVTIFETNKAATIPFNPVYDLGSIPTNNNQNKFENYKNFDTILT